MENKTLKFSIIFLIIVCLGLITCNIIISYQIFDYSEKLESFKLKLSIDKKNEKLKVDNFKIALNSARDSTYLIKSELTDKNRIFQGSGVLIGKNKLLTKAHVVVGNVTFVYLKSGYKIPTKLIKIDPFEDLALLEVNLDCPCTSISKEILHKDDNVTLVGFPSYYLLKSQITTTGKIASIDDKLIINADASNGMSGGGVFQLDPETGEAKVVGIIDSIINFEEMKATYITIGSSIKEINDFLNSDFNKIDDEIRQKLNLQ